MFSALMQHMLFSAHAEVIPFGLAPFMAAIALLRACGGNSYLQLGGDLRIASSPRMRR